MRISGAVKENALIPMLVNTQGTRGKSDRSSNLDMFSYRK